MQQLTVPLDDGEKLVVGNELTRLFALHGENFGKEKKAAFVEELAESGMPIGAILAGIKSLVHDDLKTIKYSTIRDSVQRHLEPEDVSNACKECFDGLVIMGDEQGRRFSLGCKCSRGHQRSMALHLAQWNGEQTMFRRGRLIEIVSKIPMGGS